VHLLTVVEGDRAGGRVETLDAPGQSHRDPLLAISGTRLQGKGVLCTLAAQEVLRQRWPRIGMNRLVADQQR